MRGSCRGARAMRAGGWWALAAALALALRAAPAAGSLLPFDAEQLRASVGGFAVMNCHLDFPFGNEIPYHLQWDKDGETIFSWSSGEGRPQVADRWGGRVRRLGGGGGPGGPGGDDLAPALGLGRGSINVSAVRETDAGLYRCQVTFPNRTPPARNNGTFYYLDVDGGNSIVTPPMNVTVLEGERAELECLPKMAESTVEWYKDGSPVSSLPELALRSELAANGSLVIRRAASTDPGEYECHVRAPNADSGSGPDAGTPLQSASAFLDVQYKAKVVYSPKERFLPYGKPASLDCHFSANPPLTNLRWEKDGFLFDPYNVPGVFYSRNGSLLFNQVDESHEGQYSCTPYNALGTEGASAGVRVRVQLPPALAARPQPLYVARLGATVTMPCAVAGYKHYDPPPLTWLRKDGSPLPVGRHSLDGGNLTIVDVAEEDRGVYECTASNEAASVRAESELLVENVPPRAPYNLTARASPHSLHLAWVPGHNGLEVDYIVWYRERTVSEWRTMKILTRGVTDATLVGLRPATEYELRVLSQDHIGDGLFSKPIYVTTLDPVFEGEAETAFASATTVESSSGEMSSGSSARDSAGLGAGGDELEVAVRLIDEGALVRWRQPGTEAAGEAAGGAAGGAARCTLRWYWGAAPGERLLATVHTHHDYMLVSGVEEGGSYWARVQCGPAAGGAALRVPEYTRLRGVAAGVAAAALLLAALAAALYVARRRLWPAPRQPRARARPGPGPGPGPVPPPPPPRSDKRLR